MVTTQEKQEYIRLYKIAREVVNDGDVIPTKTDEEILKFISERDWMIIPFKDETDKRQSKKRTNPNIWFTLDIANRKITAGVVFNTPSVEKAVNLLSSFSSKEKSDLLESMKSLDNDYFTKVEKKVRTKHYKQTPDYHTVLKEQTNTIDEKLINDIISRVEQCRKEGLEEHRKAKGENRYFTSTPSISIADIEMPMDDDTFRKRMLELANILRICSRIRSTSDIRRIERSNRNSSVNSDYDEDGFIIEDE